MDAYDQPFSNTDAVRECEELAFRLLASLPRARLAMIQRKIAPLLQFDIVGTLPAELSMQIFSHLSASALLNCGQVSKRWNVLANEQLLWKALCVDRGLNWRPPALFPSINPYGGKQADRSSDSDDEGMGDSDEDDFDEEDMFPMRDGDSMALAAAKAQISRMYAEVDAQAARWHFDYPPSHPAGSSSSAPVSYSTTRQSVYLRSATPNFANRLSAPPSLRSVSLSHISPIKPDYKLLYLTHNHLRSRFRSSSYVLSTLEARGPLSHQGHTNTIYCLQLYTYPNGNQVLFTGSRDKTVRQWDLTTGQVENVISGLHDSSILSICVRDGYLASAGSDRRVVVWDLEKNRLVKVISDHDDSVLCVRFDDKRLVSCSKDRTVRTYSFPTLKPEFVLGAHRAAVNAVSLSHNFIVSGSGDRSIRLWDAETGKLLKKFENHHSRGIASIDFQGPSHVVSGSSDRHLRVFDVATNGGWGTADNHDTAAAAALAGTGATCTSCGQSRTESGSASVRTVAERERAVHGDLVRSVALGEDWVVSGSYDKTIKVETLYPVFSFLVSDHAAV
jgi:WD40 repeat protein